MQTNTQNISHQINDEGIIIKHTKLKDKDIICTILTRNTGKISAIAKGARRPGSKVSGSSQLLNHVNLKFALGRNLDIINEIVIDEAFSSQICKDYDKFVAAEQMCNLVDKLISFEHEIAGQQYLLLLRALRMLSGDLPAGINAQMVSNSYTLRALAIEGFEFATDNPQNSGVALPKGLPADVCTEYIDELMLGDWQTVADMAGTYSELNGEITKLVAIFAVMNTESRLNAFRF